MSGKLETAVIIIGHGSRAPSASKDMETVAEKMRGKKIYGMVETCSMSRTGPFFPETLEKCVKHGARMVVLIPYFLHMGLHTRLDLPAMMQEQARKYPGVKMVFGKHLGFDDSMVDLVMKRVEESLSLGDVRDIKLPDREKFPVADDQLEFVPMTPDEAREYMKAHGGHHHNH